MSVIYCGTCAEEMPASERICPSCGAVNEYPIVRDYGSLIERESLKKKTEGAVTDAKLRECEGELEAFRVQVAEDAGVVVTMPSSVAATFVDNSRNVYESYVSLVKSGKLLPYRDEVLNKIRQITGDLLWGNYSDEIRYGVLSLDGMGVDSYGDIHCRLHDRMVKDRVGFLECDSTVFVKEHKLGASHTDIPAGHRAVWDNRADLAVAKHAQSIRGGQGAEEWPELLVSSGGMEESDMFIEAHLYGPFTASSIELVIESSAAPKTRHEKALREVVMDKFRQLGKTTQSKKSP